MQWKREKRRWFWKWRCRGWSDPDPQQWQREGITLCMLSHFSGVQLFVIPWTVVRQAPLPMGILQTRILEQIAMPSSWGIFPTQGSNKCLLCLLHPGRFFTTSSTVGFFHLLLSVCIRRPCSSAFSPGLFWLRKLGWPSQPLWLQIFFFLLKLE